MTGMFSALRSSSYTDDLLSSIYPQRMTTLVCIHLKKKIEVNKLNEYNEGLQRYISGSKLI